MLSRHALAYLHLKPKCAGWLVLMYQEGQNSSSFSLGTASAALCFGASAKVSAAKHQLLADALLCKSRDANPSWAAPLPVCDKIHYLRCFCTHISAWFGRFTLHTSSRQKSCWTQCKPTAAINISHWGWRWWYNIDLLHNRLLVSKSASEERDPDS